MPRKTLFGLLLTVFACGGCTGEVSGSGPESDRSPQSTSEFRPLPAGLRTLTPPQYAQSVREVLGIGPTDGPISAFGQWDSSIAAARGGFSSVTVETYETLAREASRFMFEDPVRRDSFVGCVPEVDLSCADTFIARVGRLAFRRPLSEAEVARWSGVASRISSLLSDPYAGLEYALTGVLQSPHFLYRVELGTPVPGAGHLAYTDIEMATRLAFLIWNQTPDAQLLTEAEAGRLSSDVEIQNRVQLMVDDPRSRGGLREFLAELLDASAVGEIEKDLREYPGFDQELAASMEEQLVRTAETAVAEEGYRSLFTTRKTFANDELAELMGLEPMLDSQLIPVELPATGPRAGLLSTPGYLALHAYPGKTSPALRGLFVRQRLLCQTIPPPPASVDTTLPERPAGELVTTRVLVAEHQENPSCSGCHALMDPIGLGLEEFDAIGRFRSTENMLDIDPSGVLEGEPFMDAQTLGEVVAQHPQLLPCLVANLYAYAAANTVSVNDAALEPLVQALVEDDLTSAIIAIATSDLFRFAWVAAEEEVAP